MWKIIICALLLFQRALSAPSSRCMEICNNRNSQYFSNTNCCASSLVASTDENKNWTNHNDFQTPDGAAVHTKAGEFNHGNTHSNFNEMSYYKEFKSGDNQNFGSNHNFGSGHGISQKLEDLSSTSSHSTFESMFQSRFSDLIKNFHESFRHLQELKTKDQLPVQDCQYPCVPIDEQISRLQQDVTSQQQYMQRMREDLWSKMQNQNTVTETEHIPSQQLTQSNHQTGQVTKETNRYESYQNEKITTNPQITTTITKQPVKYTSHPHQSQTDYYSGTRHESTQGYGSRTQGQYPDQPQRAGQDYYSGSVSRQDSTQNYASATQDQTHNRQTSYPDQSIQHYYSGSASKLDSQSQTGYNQQNSIHNSRNRVNDQTSLQDQNSSQYGQNYATGIQSQAGYSQDTTNYERRNRVSQAQRADRPSHQQYNQEHTSGTQNQGQTQGQGLNGAAYGYHATYGSNSYYSSLPQDQQSSAYRAQQSGSQSQGYGQHSAYSTQSGYQTDGSQSQGEYNPQGSLTYTHNSMSHSSLTQNNAAFGASSNGKLTHGLIQMGSAADCNDEVQPAPYRRYKRHILTPNNRHHHHYHHHHNHQEQYPDDFSQQQFQDDFQQGPISSKADEFGEPTKIEKVSQKEIEDLSQQVEDIRNGKVDTQDLYQHQDFSQQQHKFPEQSPTNYYQTGGFDDYPPSSDLTFGQKNKHSEGSQTYDQQNHGFDDQYPNYTPRGFNQKTVGSLTLDQHARDSFNFNQFPTPVLAPDSNPPAGNQRLDGINSQTPRPAPKPTSRPRNTKPLFINTATNAPTTKNTTNFENINSEKIESKRTGSSAESQQILTPPDMLELLGEKASQHIMKPSQVLQKHENTSFKDVSRTDQPSQKPKNLFEILSQKTLKQENTKHEKPFEDFSQQDTLSFQQHENPVDFSQQENLKPFGDFSQQVSNPIEVSFNQQHGKPSEDFSQQVLKHKEESFQRHENPFLDYSDQQNLKPFGDFSQQENLKPFGDFSQQVSKPSEDSFHQQNVKPFGDFSQQVLPAPEESFQKHKNPFLDFSQQQNLKPFGDFSQQENLKPFGDLSQQISKSSKESFHQQNVKPFGDFSQQVSNPFEESFHQQNVKPFGDFPQQVSNPSEEYFHQQHENPFLDFSHQQNVKPFGDFSQQISKSSEKSLHQQNVQPFEDFSQQLSQTREKTFQQHVDPFEVISQQIQDNQKDSLPKIESQKVNIPYNSQKFEKPKISREEFSVQKPLDDFSQYIQKSLEDPLPKSQKPFEDLSQHVQIPENLSFQNQISQDDSLQKIPKISPNIQQAKKNYSEEIEKTLQKVSKHVAQHMQELYKKDLSQTSDLNRNKDITQLPQSFQQQEHHSNLDSFQQPEEITLGRQWHLFHGPGDLTNEDLHLGSHLGSAMEKISTPSVREKEEQLEGKLEFGQIVQNPQVQSELPILSLQPRILQAYGGKGPYDPMHSEDIFSDVRQNPSATFAPVVIDDPWDIRERHIESYMANEEGVIPLDTMWTYPDAFPITPVTEKPNLGFWDRVGRKFSTAVDKAKDKARGIFG